MDSKIIEKINKLLALANNTLCEGNDAEMFVTVWIGIIDLSTGEMKCANAGHEYPVLMRAGGSYELVRDKHGLVLAAMDNIPMREYEMKLEPGDRKNAVEGVQSLDMRDLEDRASETKRE